MYYLNTRFPTIIFDDYIMDPSIMNNLIEESDEKRIAVIYDYKHYPSECNSYLNFVRDICSEFLKSNNFEHNKEKWYIDAIRYKLKNVTKRVKSGLAWHCENDNGKNLITVLMYMNIDEGVIDGNLRYKDKNNIKKLLNVKSGTTVIMDGKVPHKPQDPYGTGYRDLVVISFEK